MIQKSLPAVSLILVGLTILLWACAPNQQPVLPTANAAATTFTPTAAPTLTLSPRPTVTWTPTPELIATSTPVPLLTAHEWTPDNILVSYNVFGGDGGAPFRMHLPDQLTLLSDGRLFVLVWDQDFVGYQFLTARLSRQETCQILNTIDQAGFFDYDHGFTRADPANPWFQGNGSTITEIDVQAWRTKSAALDSSALYLGTDYPDIYPVVLPALANTDKFLATLVPENSEIYHADRVGLWLQKFDSAYSSGSLTEPIIWPIQSLRLSDIPDGGLTKWDPPGAILHGQDAETIFQLFQERITDWGIVFVDGDQRYVVFARPLMPHEYTATLAPLTPSLHCLPEDGWISLP